MTNEDLRKARMSRGWTQLELANKLGVANTQISRWERNGKISKRNKILLKEILIEGISELKEILLKNEDHPEFPFRTRYLSEQQVAEITGISHTTLQQHRWQGKGLPYSKLGRSVRYLERDVFEYMEKHRVETAPIT